jgi:hypothetical protein
MGAQRWRRRCSRTAPTCTRRPMAGAAAGRYFGQRSACAAPAVGDGTDAMRYWTHRRTHAIHSRTNACTDVAVCMRRNTHTFAITKAHTHSHAELRIYDTDGRTHSAGLT